jgi:hypothetical protein
MLYPIIVLLIYSNSTLNIILYQSHEIISLLYKHSNRYYNILFNTRDR